MAARFLLEHGFEGPFKAAFWELTAPDGKVSRVTGRQASMISMLLAGYQFKPGFHPMDPFTEEGAVSDGVPTSTVAEGSRTA